MKKMLTMGALALALLSSCSNDCKLEETVIFNQLNLISSDNQEDAANISDAVYNLYVNYTDSKANISVKDVTVNGKKLSISGENIGLKNEGGNFSFSESSLKCSGADVTDFHGLWLLTPNISEDGLYASSQFVCNFKVDNKWTVQSFPKNALYTGTTDFKYLEEGQEVVFNNPGVRYGICIHADTMTADVYAYNFKASQKMPVTINFTLRNLKVVAHAGSYAVEGENLIPILPDGSEMPMYVFKKFNLTTTDVNLTKVAIDYVVGERSQYSATFSGSYIRTFE